MKRAYCLYRVSDRGQVEKNDIPMQRIACRTYAEERGWEIVKEFAEKGVSGYKLSMNARDAILEIREAVKMEKFDVLLVYMFDRIGRRDDETPFVVEWLVRSGIEVWSVCEGEQRFDNHVDKLTNYIRYWQAAGESEKISERTRTRIRQLTKEGVFTGGACPYGYDLVPGDRLNKKKQTMKQLQINEQEAEIVRLIYDKAIREGLGPFRIARYLNKQGVPTRRGKPWNQSSVGRILTNPIYTGVLQKGGVSSGQIPSLQIIDAQDHKRSVAIRDARKRHKPEGAPTVPMQTRGMTLLSGFLYCAHCGARANSTISRKQYRRKDGSVYRNDRRLYRCNGSVDGIPTSCDGPRTYRAGRVDEAFQATITELLTALEALPAETILDYKYQIAIQERRSAWEKENAFLEEKQKDCGLLEKEIVKSLRGESAFDVQLLQKILDDAKKEQAESVERLCVLGAKLQNAEHLRREIEIKQLKYCGLKQAFDMGTMEEKKMLLSVMIRRVEIGRDYQLHIMLSPDFDRFLDGLIEMR